MMDHGMISKIKKAKVYAEEHAERIEFESLRVRLQGDNNQDPHIVEYDNGQWSCDEDGITLAHTQGRYLVDALGIG